MGGVQLWPLVAYLIASALLVTLMLALSYVLGERHREGGTVIPFESGVLPTGSARLRVSTKFYLVAILFVIFDVEAIFLFAWAVAARELGWPGYVEALVFALVLLVTLGYLERSGALDWVAEKRSTAVRYPSKAV